MSLTAEIFGRDSLIYKGANLGTLGLADYFVDLMNPETKGPRLSDLSVQTSTYGAELPRIYGMVAVAGNLLWLENNKLKETVKKNESGGKGGSGSEPSETYSYSATFIIGICASRISGVRRIWCMDKLIYNAGSDDLATIIASNNAAAGWTLYLGTDDQMPDSRYEADVGVGNASAFRGIAHIVFRDFKLKDYGDTLQAAQFKFEVVATSGSSLNTLVDIVPVTTTAFGPRSGAAFYSDFSGVQFLNQRAVGSATVSEIHLNRQRVVPEVITGTAGDPVVAVRSPVSYGGLWYLDQIDDLFDSTRITRQSDGASFNIYAPKEVQHIREISEFVAVCLYPSTPLEADLTAAVRVSLALPPSFGIISETLVRTSSFRISTAGDAVYEYRIQGAGLSVKIYSDAFDLQESYSIALPVGQFPEVTTVMTFGVGMEVNSYFLDGDIYLLYHSTGADTFRLLRANASGVISNITFGASGSTTTPHAFYMHSPTLGAIVTNRVIQFATYDAGLAQLSDVLDAELGLSALITSADLSLSQITAGVRGYRASGGTIRSAIEPLQKAFPFDVIPSGYQIKFIPRGQSSVVSIPYADLGATSGKTPEEIFQQSREMDTQLPARTSVSYLDAGREYASSEQYSERINTEAVNKLARELAIVMSADEAAGVAEMIQWSAWLERTPAAFTLPPVYQVLEPGDVVTVTTPGASYELRLTGINTTQDGRLECKAVSNRAALYAPNASGGEGVTPDGTIPLPGASIFLPLDIPVIDETIQNLPGFVGVMTGENPGWSSGTAFRSLDGGQTWTEMQGYVGPATLGYARDTLPASDCTLVDQRTLTLDMISGELDSITRDQMLVGAHYVAYGADGRWEIVRFQSATLQADGSYLVSGFVRGEFGTEWASGLHAADDYFVLLDDPDSAFIGMPVALIATASIYRGVTAGASIDSASDIPFTYQGVNLECLSPVYPIGSRDVSSNFSGQFTRRSRLSSSWWATGVVAPVGEATESYEVNVMDGTDVVRTIATVDPNFMYSAVDQSADFGSAQASITFRIYQLSAVVGRGYPLEVTL